MATMAEEAAKRLRALIEAGAEIPYEVHESGDGSPLCRYEPLTEAFVRDHAEELGRLDSFGATSAALEAAGLAGHYLEEMGIPVPTDPRARGELASLAFLCRLWMDSSDFSLDRERLSTAIAELEEGADVLIGEIEVVVPVRGLVMPVTRLELAGVTLVRADTVDVPAEAQAGDLRGASPWEPAFVAVTRVPDPTYEEIEADAGAIAVATFRRLITTLHLFKAGGVGLGPHAWTRVAGDRWRRIATGSGRPRPGGYRLTEDELGGLAALSRALASPSSPLSRQAPERPGLPSALARALSRFEAGLERNVIVEALNDHLLALRFVLEGAGPAQLGLPMRVAALCAEPERRGEVKAIVDRAIGLERELWSGEPAPGPGALTPAETGAELEELSRAILKDAACGHLGSDLRTTADEILLADGLAVGDGAAEQRGATAEWDIRDESELDEEIVPEEPVEPTALDLAPSEPELIDELDSLDAVMKGFGDGPGTESGTESEDAIEEEQMRLVPSFMRREEVTAAGTQAWPLSAVPDAEPADGPVSRKEPEPERRVREPGSSPVLRLIEQTRAEREARHERVADLFPAPETTEWNIREVAYDRTRRARVRSAEPAGTEAQHAS